MTHLYSDTFFNYIDRGARASAQAVASLIIPDLHPRSVLDVGCGRGAWLDEWQRAGVADVIGIDGDYVDQRTLAIDPALFRAHDLTGPFDLGRRFDLVLSLEVAEHLPRAAAETLVENLIRHGDIVVFSAASPGQGGEHHINEQPPEFWRRLFARHGYHAYDFLRPHLRQMTQVEPWYRYNTMIYARDGAALPATWTMQRVPDERKIQVGGNVAWRLRRLIVGMMPRRMVDYIAMKNAARHSRAV